MVSEVTISDDSFRDWSPQGVRGAIRGAISSECFRDLGPTPSGIRILEGQSQDHMVFTALRGVRRVEADRDGKTRIDGSPGSECHPLEPLGVD